MPSTCAHRQSRCCPTGCAYEFDIDTIPRPRQCRDPPWQDLVTGPELEYRRDTETGFTKQPTFVLGLYKGRGKAEELQFTGPEQYRIQRGTYSTCVGDAPAWRLEVAQLDLDENTSVGVAGDARIYLGNLPVARAAAVQLPLRNERKSGFLWQRLTAPAAIAVSISSCRTTSIWAPNYDATLTPRLMSKRGVLFNGQACLPVRHPVGPRHR